jgi:MinD superfamily P-loop ATPase
MSHDNAVGQIVIISGKGGTGKTTVCAALSHLLENKVICDTDVDAANLHLLLSPEVGETRDFFGSERAVVDRGKCTRCTRCVDTCRFDAFAYDAEGFPYVREEYCEGCAACIQVCRPLAVRMIPHKSGELYISETAVGPMVHARLGIAEDNSGRLVSEVRKAAAKIAQERGLSSVLIDGPPGIGCPVIASITGTSLAVAVTEPTVSGAHDLMRILTLTAHFEVPALVVINKFDINTDMSDTIAREAENAGAPVIGRIVYHEGVIEAVRKKKSLTEWGPAEVRREIAYISKEIEKRLDRNQRQGE